MWIRLKLDIAWRDLWRGGRKAAKSSDRLAVAAQLESFWSAGRDDALACLSVRSGFDLLLQTLALPAGSEILFSAVTIRDMPKIAAEHGYVPVPVDVCGSDFHLDVDSLRQAITPRTKMLVLAHLFGARPPIDEVLAVAREHSLLVVEDCAQAWCELPWRGCDEADASLFSFGTIKTATALGAALCRVKDPALLARMRDIQSHEPVQPRENLFWRYAKFALLKIISTKLVFGTIVGAGRLFGKNVDDILNGLTRGFSSDSLFEQLRQQPSAGLLGMLDYRLRTYDPARVERRVAHARRIVANLGLEMSHAELLDRRHSFWLFPLLTDRPDALVAYLRNHGFDTTQRGRMEVISPPADRPQMACRTAEHLLSRTVFLPCYPELPEYAIDDMCDVIRAFHTECLMQAKPVPA